MAGKEKLSARAVAAAKPGRYCDGRGLWLVVSKSGARKWIFRFTFGGRVTEMGLGDAAVSFAAARDKADEARKLVASGIDPRRCVGMVDDDDVDAPEWDELTTLAKLLRDQNPKPERYRGKKGDALRELDELEEFIQRRDATPVGRVWVGVRLWKLNKTTLGVGPFCWRDRRRPRGAKNTEIDGQILMRAIDSKPLKGSLGAALRSLVEEFMANRRLPQLSVESHIKRLHKLAKRSGLA